VISFTVRRAPLPENGPTKSAADTTAKERGTSMQTPGLRRFLVAPLAALAVGITLLLTPHSAAADQRDFTLRNASSSTIMRF
jgi:hypothetical protein